MKRLSYKNGLHACIMKELQMVIDVIKYVKNTDKKEQLKSFP